MIGTLRTPKRAVLDFRKNMLSVVQVLILSTACFIATGNGLPEKVVTTESPADMVLPPYCTPTFSWTMEPICNVTFNTINNNSSCVVGSGPFYNNYSGISTTVTKGVSYPISVSGNTDGPYTNRINVFIDFNQDNDFSDPGEEFQLGNIVNCGNCAVTGTILIPATALTGNTTMRVMKRFNQYATPCNTEGWGEVEDYVLNIQNSGPPLTLTATSVSICAGQSATVSITPGTFGNYNQYTWSPAGVTGTAPNFTFSPATTTTYTLTGLNTSTLATNTATFTVNVNPAPSIVTVTPAAPSICPGGIATLTASGGTVSGVTAFSENFNGPATGWTTQTTGSPNPWYLYPNNSYVFLNSIISNDASGFAAVDSDAGGSGSTTISSLISPSFSLASYTTASLNFWHFYRYFNGPESGEVQISTNGGATYTTVLTITANAGAATNFANANVSLNTFVGQPDVRIRFRYTASWDFGWAIDNIVVTGNATSGVTWSPAAGLFTNAAGTIPYTGGVTNTVYASPTNTTIYTATATNSVTGCTRTRQVTVTVPLVPGTISNNQIVCGGLAENIILTGHTGTVVTWQSAPDPSFTTGVTNIPGSAGATTLFSTTIGNVTAPMYIRAQILGGTCTAYTNSVFLDVISATWNGTTWTPAPPTSTTKAIFTGNYSSTGDLQACSVLVTSGDVVFNSGHNLIVQNEVVVDNEVIATGKSLSFEDDASLVQFNDAAINSGTIIYKRNSSPMIQYDYTYWSSPVYPQTLVGLSPMTLADKYFWWNPTTYNWQSIAAPGITVMTPALGYIIRAPQGFTAVPQVYPGVFNGVPNNGVISIGIQVNGLNDNNLLGNPYPSAIDADLL
nr:hypothetical protein [Flavobacterium sp.]